MTGLSTWDVSNVKDFNGMFQNTKVQLTAAWDNSLEHWETNQAECMGYMFDGYKGPVQGLQRWNVSNVWCFDGMLKGSSADLTGRCNSSLHTWDTHSACSLWAMFEFFEGQVTELQAWNVSKVSDFKGMFFGSHIDLTEASHNSLRDWNMRRTGYSHRLSRHIRSSDIRGVCVVVRGRVACGRFLLGHFCPFVFERDVLPYVQFQRIKMQNLSQR